MSKISARAYSRLFSALGTMLCVVSLVVPTFGEQSLAATYYISPTGSDSNSGASVTAPWKTFKFAIPRLRPLDTLFLLDGVYDTSNSGYADFTNIHGTPGFPITIKALNERRAWLKGDAWTNTIQIRSSSYLVLDGMRVSSADNSGQTAYIMMPIAIHDSSHLVLKKLLVHHVNRYTNAHLIFLRHVTNSTVEDSELYFFNRDGILLDTSDHNTLRRIYCHPRYGDIAGGRPSGNPSGGDMCIALYPASDNLIENFISDGNNYAAFDVEATAAANNNRFLGGIALNGIIGGILVARGNSDAQMPHDNVIKDFVVINPQGPGIYSRSAKGTRCDRCTVLNGQNAGLVADTNLFTGSGTYSFYSQNSLSAGNRSSGFHIGSVVQTWKVEFGNAFGNSPNFAPAISGSLSNIKSADPVLGVCKVFIPDGSPMKGAGSNGEDIGANVLYRYQDGELTATPLWDPVTGQFPCGAIVGGLNDVPGSSCFDVHQRLNVNTNGCSFPATYPRSSVSTTTTSTSGTTSGTTSGSTTSTVSTTNGTSSGSTTLSTTSGTSNGMTSESATLLPASTTSGTSLGSATTSTGTVTTSQTLSNEPTTVATVPSGNTATTESRNIRHKNGPLRKH